MAGLRSDEAFHGCRREGVVLFRSPAADVDRAAQPAVAVHGHAARDEQQRTVERGGQGVEEAAGQDLVDEVGGGCVEL